MTKAVWKKGNKLITGSWRYCRASGEFKISLNSRDPVTGLYRNFSIIGEHPEFNGWILVT